MAMSPQLGNARSGAVSSIGGWERVEVGNGTYRVQEKIFSVGFVSSGQGDPKNV